jgi:hypothetical protein
VVTLTPLVGRQDVLADLDRLLAAGRTGRGSLVLITGEPGIGKTRVAEEVVARAEGLTVHWSWCTSERSGGSLRPWKSLLRLLVGSSTEAAAAVRGSPRLSGLLDDRATTGEDPELARALLSSDLTELLQLVLVDAPLLLVLDDLHDAQHSTLRVLADIAGSLRGMPLVVVATARDGALEWEGREQVLGELLGQSHRLALGALNAEEVATLVGAPVGSPLATSVLERSGGNALLVTEAARAKGQDGVPASLRAMVSARLSRLPAETRRVVQAASVLGPRFRLDVLADTAADSLTDLGTALGPAQAATLITPTDSGEARFSHELLRDAVYADLSEADRVDWHARAGLVLDALCRRGRDVEPAQVAHHLMRAGRAHHDLASAHTEAAARRAASVSAFEDAVQWFGQALELAAGPAATTVLLLERAHARRGTGDHEQARADILRAAELAPSAPLLAQAALALGSGSGGFEVDANDGLQIDLLRRANQALPDEALAERAMVMARLSLAGSLTHSPTEQLAQARSAVDLARRSQDDGALGAALAALCDALAGPDHVQERLGLSDEIIALARDSTELELLGRRLRLVALLELGDRNAAEQEAKAYELRAQAVHHPLYLWYVPLWQGFWALAEGRLADCERFTREAERIGAGSENARLLTVTQDWCRLGQSEDVDGLTALFDAIDIQQFPGTWGGIAHALSLVQRGRADEAAVRFEAVAPLIMGLPRDSEWLALMGQAAEVIDAIGGHAIVSQLYAALTPYQGLFVIEGIGAATRGPVDRYLALLAPDAAHRARHEEAAEEANRRIGAVPFWRETSLSLVRTTVAYSWRKDGDGWLLNFQGRQTRVRDSKGMRDLTELIKAQGREVAALDLYGGPVEAPTGEVLDAEARASYKQRLRELEDRDSLSEREALEREALIEQLASAYGLGGRVRRMGSSSERARSAVTARVRDAVKRITEYDPDLGRHLKHSVRTGTFCAYEPEAPVAWDLTQ